MLFYEIMVDPDKKLDEPILIKKYRSKILMKWKDPISQYHSSLILKIDIRQGMHFQLFIAELQCQHK